MGSGKYVLGGLLAGVGQGMVMQGAAKREAALRMLEIEARNAENARDREFRGAENAADRDMRTKEADADRTLRREEGDADRTFRAGESAADRAARIAEGDKDRGFRREEGDKDRQFRSNESAADRQAQFDRQQNEFDAKRNGLLADEDLIEVADPDNPGRTKMVPKSQASGLAGKDSAEVMGQEARDQDIVYEDQARTIVDGMAGYFSSDESDFGAGGREAAVNKVKNALKRGDATVVINGKTVDLGGASGSGAPPAGDSGEPAQPEQKPTGGAPKGAGTKEDPYKAVTQADIDWFKKEAPKGAILSANGKLYVK